MSAHLAERLAERIGDGLPLSENQVGKKAKVSPRTIANYKAMAGSGGGPSGASLAKVDRIADAMAVDPLWLLSDLSAASLSLARAFQAFRHDQKEDVYLALLNVLEGRAALVLPESRPVQGFALQPTLEPRTDQ